jgi:hypothetical protein
MVEHSAVNYTAEQHKPLFWRRLATKLSPPVVPQLCPSEFVKNLAKIALAAKLNAAGLLNLPALFVLTPFHLF